MLFAVLVNNPEHYQIDHLRVFVETFSLHENFLSASLSTVFLLRGLTGISYRCISLNRKIMLEYFLSKLNLKREKQKKRNENILSNISFK